MLTIRMPTSSAEIAMPPGRQTSFPKTEGTVAAWHRTHVHVLADDQAEPDGGDDERDVVAAGLQQAIDERDLEHPSEQQDRDRDGDDEAGDDPDLRDAGWPARCRR